MTPGKKERRTGKSTGKKKRGEVGKLKGREERRVRIQCRRDMKGREKRGTGKKSSTSMNDCRQKGTKKERRGKSNGKEKRGGSTEAKRKDGRKPNQDTAYKKFKRAGKTGGKGEKEQHIHEPLLAKGDGREMGRGEEGPIERGKQV